MDGQDRYKVLLEAIDKERQSEENYFRKLSTEKSPKEKEQAGVLWSFVDILAKHYTVGEKIEIELERTRQVHTNHKFKVGVSVHIHFDRDERTTYKAVISYLRRNKMNVILSGDIILKDDVIDKGNCSVELIYDERPYKVMRQTIEQLVASKEVHLINLREGVAKRDLKNDRIENHAEHYESANLNDSQNKAIQTVAPAANMGIIHGPPGTGKTTTLVALSSFLVKSEKQILVCAPSNNAVDLLALKMSEQGLNVLRIGNVSRISDTVVELTLDEKARSHDEWQHIKKVKIEAEKARKNASKFKRSFGAQQRSDRNAMYKESRDLRKWARDLEDKLMDKILSNVQVICSTLVGSASRILQGRMFNTVIIDEASQALEPECWTAILKAKRVIFAGDHMQLPPTVKSQEAVALGLSNTLLSHMMDHVDACHLLDTQYRMNDKILSFSNFKFYDDLLKSDPSVANHSLAEGAPVLEFIDTSGCGFEESFNPEFKSYFSEGEFFILSEHVLKNHDVLALGNIGIISPYAEQVRFLREKVSTHEILKTLDVRVGSIDGFQGQERDTIYISLVRSNERSEIGFLKDQRRLNVALTRARKRLVIIGDGATLTSNPLYLELVEHVEKTGHYQSAWEYMA